MKILNHHSAAESSSVFSTFNYKVYSDKPVEIKQTPVQHRLYQNLPQIFYKVTRVGFDLPKSTTVKLGIYDVFGREVCILVDKVLSAGSYEVVFDATQYDIQPGMLMYKLKTEEFVDTKKMFLLKNNIHFS